MEPLLKDIPEIRTPLYSGHFAVTQICFLNGNFPPEMRTPLYTGHLTRSPRCSQIEGFHCSQLTLSISTQLTYNAPHIEQSGKPVRFLTTQFHCSGKFKTVVDVRYVHVDVFVSLSLSTLRLCLVASGAPK